MVLHSPNRLCIQALLPAQNLTIFLSSCQYYASVDISSSSIHSSQLKPSLWIKEQIIKTGSSSQQSLLIMTSLITQSLPYGFHLRGFTCTHSINILIPGQSAKYWLSLLLCLYKLGSTSEIAWLACDKAESKTQVFSPSKSLRPPPTCSHTQSCFPHLSHLLV